MRHTMKISTPIRALMISACLVSSLPFNAWASGDIKKGADVFAGQCNACHSTLPGKTKIGPPLFGVLGRKAGSIQDFMYSEAMKGIGFTWTPDMLDAYIAHPKKVVPGNRMPFNGLDDAAARADLVAYLQSLK